MSKEETFETFNQLRDVNYEYDPAKEFSKLNPAFNKRGIDKFTYQPENHFYWAAHWRQNESRLAHGYPFTGFLQAALVFATGAYTAKQQGYPITHAWWKAHHFDWIKFMKRGSVFGIGGGLVLGTIFFGNPSLSISKLKNLYTVWFVYHDPTDPAYDAHYFTH